MKKNRIRLTESQLNKVIRESVQNVLSELSGDLLDRAHKAARDDFWKHKLSRKWSNDDTPECEKLRDEYNEHERIAQRRLRQAGLFNKGRARNNDYDIAAREAEHKREVLSKYRAEYENACDDLYYGYGYKFWRSHNNSIEDENDAKIVWNTALEKMGNEY